jgi:hypothetical protein
VDTAANQATKLVDLKKEVNGPLTAYNNIVYIQTQDTALQRINVATGALLPSISLLSSK